MKARDLAAALLSHPDLTVAVRLEPSGGEARVLPIRGAGCAPLTARFLICARDPADQELDGQAKLFTSPAREGAAERLCRIYFEIAAEALGEDEVRRRRDARIESEDT